MPNYYNPYINNMGFPNSNPYSPNFNNSNNVSLKTFDYVNGIEGAKAYQVMPNQMIPLFDNDNPIVYLKQANLYGQATIKAYKLVDFDLQNKLVGQSNIDTSNFVSLTEFNALKQDLEALKKELMGNAKSVQTSSDETK